MHTATETVRFLQMTQQGYLVRRVEDGGKVEQRQSSEISAVDRTENVRQNLQDFYFRQMMGP